MSSEGPIIPFATYNLALKPYDPTPAINEEFPVTIKINLAALDPEAVDDDAEPSTLRLMKKKITLEDYEEFDSEDEEQDELDEEEEEETKKSSKKEEEPEEEESDEALDEDEIDEEVEEYVLCTLSPKLQYQQTLELTITPDEDIYFVVTGSYPIHLSGNYVTHSYYEEDDDFLYDDLSDDEGDEDYFEGEDDDDAYDLTPDEDEIIENRIEEIVEENEEEKPKPKKESKKNKKRAAEEEEASEPKKSKKQQKEDAKKVKFDKELEKGPIEKKSKETAATANKVKKQTLSAGVIIEDRTVGEGKKAKNNDRVGVRYIGKLKNGKVFDKNVKGKPFVFKLGKGEVIRGWDIGVSGMSVGGERRIIIPAAAAYGSQSLPGIPANSELTFDVKLVSIK